MADRSESGQCPVCSGRQVLAGFNDLLTSRPELASEAFEWDPTTVSAGRGTTVNVYTHQANRIVKQVEEYLVKASSSTAARR